MDRSRVEAWASFVEEIAGEGASWPRELWFAAVEDAMAAALPADSALLAHFRQDVAELCDLERFGSAHDPDGARRAQLDAQIQRLVAVADETIRATPDAAPSTAGDGTTGAPSPPAAEPLSMRATALAFAAGLALVIAGAVGANYHQSAQIDRQLAQMQQRFERQLAELEGGLGERLQAAEAMQIDLVGLRDELRRNVDDFGAILGDSVASIMAVGDGAIADLERRLSSRGGEVAAIVDRLRERTGALDRSLDQISGDMAGTEQRLPEIARRVQGLDAQAGAVASGLDQAMAKANGLAQLSPQLEARYQQVETDIERAVAQQRATLDALGVQVTALEGDVAQAHQRFVALEQAMAGDLEQAKNDAAILEAAVAEIASTRQTVDGLVTLTRDQLSIAQRQAQQELDQMLSAMAEKADLAVLRSEDVMQRAAVEGGRRIDAEVEVTRGAIEGLRDAELQALTERAEAIRTELQQTRSGLLISWQRMDQVVAERQGSVLTGLDRHADHLEERVQAFLNALDVMVASKTTPTGG